MVPPSAYLKEAPLQQGALFSVAQSTSYQIISDCKTFSASGKAGGFLAKDWHGGPTASLGELSFQLHEDLAKEHDGEKKWGYRKVTTVELEVDATRRTKHVPGAEWLSSVSRSQYVLSGALTDSLLLLTFGTGLLGIPEQQHRSTRVNSPEQSPD